MSNQDELNWHKSSYSSAQGDNCVEVAAIPTSVHVRDSKDTALPGLTLSPHAWSTFITHAAGNPRPSKRAL